MRIACPHCGQLHEFKQFFQPAADRSPARAAVAGADGKATARLTLWYTLALALFSLTFALYVQKPWLYLLIAGLLGLWHLRLSWQFYQNPERLTARGVLMASVLYLPVLLLTAILTR